MSISLLVFFCPQFPDDFQHFFKKRRRNRERPYYWPSEEIVNKIKRTGCHIVPKPSYKGLTVIEKEQGLLANYAVLEWRMSFSMAEAILFDVLPEIAKEAFLAFKATIKLHVNNIADEYGVFHKVQSYFLKTVLFLVTESTESAFWNTEIHLPGYNSRASTERNNHRRETSPEMIPMSNLTSRSIVLEMIDEDEDTSSSSEDSPLIADDTENSNPSRSGYDNLGLQDPEAIRRSEEAIQREEEEKKEALREKRRQERTICFYKKLMDKLLAVFEKDKHLPHYWNPKIELFTRQVYNEKDYDFILNRLNTIRKDYLNHLADDWLEFQRILTYTCCEFCLPGHRPAKYIPLQKTIRCYCCSINVGNEGTDRNWDMDPSRLYVY
uniref:Mab-21-like nucleotidyltransferase domain-containing protein n=1 Tax=Clytia hemisphaerica TaxID=252671 RepID=A0A7M5XJW0_9CNID